jgi:DNA topoisomerase-1
MKLVIVESPTKARTISRFLGKEEDAIVESSYGHVRDLPKSTLGVDVEKGFVPTYVTPPKARKTLSTLKKLARDADEVVLATDEDREGEAIAWHIMEALKLGKEKKKLSRIVFHEITERAVKEALKSPRTIDTNLVDAQQARRVLDRLVGYKLSPLLWKKVMRGLSAGRVQSVAVRLIVEREREREKFVPQEYWTLHALLNTGKNEEFRAQLWKKGETILKDFDLANKKEVDQVVAALESSSWRVADVEKKETRRNALPPFTTSTLQQAASHRLRFSAKQTMMLAQQLYEGVRLTHGEEGLITYMRTDSTNLSEEARARAAEFIQQTFGKEYSAPKQFRARSKGAQEAHEAIRPTDPARTPDSIKQFLQPRQLRLYALIWERFAASQMSPAVFDSTAVTVKTDTPYFFRANGLTMKFDGFLKVWKQQTKEELLPEVSKGETVSLKELLPERHETQPPPRYSEATLVKTLEEHGIGRPSTYAPIMSTVQERGYVEKDEQRRFYPTEVGLLVNDLLVEHFPSIVDVQFTAGMEKDLDNIAEGKKAWTPVVKAFYEPFAKTLEEKEKELKKSDIKKDIPTDKVCPVCGKPVVIKLGRYGKFYACSGFPECKHTENFVETINMKCPLCKEGDVVVKRTKRRRMFYGCSRYPDCTFASWKDPREAEKAEAEKAG